jgi:hypothetical protein
VRYTPSSGFRFATARVLAGRAVGGGGGAAAAPAAAAISRATEAMAS